MLPEPCPERHGLHRRCKAYHCHSCACAQCLGSRSGGSSSSSSSSSSNSKSRTRRSTSGSKAQLLRMHIRVYSPGASTCIAKQMRVRIEDTATMERTKMLARAVQLEACQLQYPRMTRTSVRSARGTRDSTASPATCSSVEPACRDHVPFKPIRKQAGSRTPAHDMKNGWTQASRSVGVSGR